MKGQEISWIGRLVTTRQILRAAAHQGKYFLLVMSEGEITREIDGQLEIDRAREGDCPVQRNLRLRLIDLAATINVVSSCHPERQVTAGRMAHGNYPGKVQRVALRKIRDKVEACRYILKRSRPAPARVADSAVFD